MKVKLKDITLDAGTQARASINPDTVTEYAERMTEGDVFPPVVLFHDGSEYYVGDGFHRILSAERLTFTDIEAEVRKGTPQDALWYALGANRTNGQRMTRGDIRHAVEVALKTWPDKTQQEIACQVGCVQSYVARIKESLIITSDIEIPPVRTNTRGQERPTTYTRKETQQTDEQEKEEMTPKPHMTKKQLKQTPPAMGMHLARLAIMDLEQITKKDRERQQAFDYVKGWINENED